MGRTLDYEFSYGDQITVTVDTTVTAVWRTISAGGTNNGVQTPQTGDNSHMVLWLSLLMLSTLGVAATIITGKKKYSVK